MTAFTISLDGSPIAAIGFDASSSDSSWEALAAQETGPSTPGPAGPATPGATTPVQGPATPSSDGSGEGTAPTAGSPMQTMMTFGIIGVVIYFLIFAPERKARKKKEEMLGGIKKGDKVVTTGGLHGEVAEVKDDTVTLKAGDTRLTFARASVHEVRQPKTEE